MKFKPILFSTSMVQAIMAGHKSMTRRVAKFIDGRSPEWSGYIADGGTIYGSNNIPASKAKYQPGDILWVRETWKVDASDHENDGYAYRADGYPEKYPNNLLQWRPSIFMPKEACRLFLRVTDVKAERLNELAGEDARKEGIEATDEYGAACYYFRILWDNLNAKRGYGWDTNPWVWVYSFDRVDKPEGWPDV